MKIFFIDGQKKGEVHELSPPGVSIGRELDNDIVLEGEGESRYHAKLEYDGSLWKIKDLGSTNGTKLNGEKLTPDEPVTLKDGDKILIGAQTMLFAEKLPDKPEVLPATEEKDARAANEKTSDKDENPHPISIKPPAPINEEPDSSPEKLDEKSSKSFSNFFDDQDDATDSDSKPLFGESTDFFGKSKQNISQTEHDGKKHAGMLFYISVFSVAIILVSIFIMYDQNKQSAEKKNTTATVKKRSGAPLLVLYEKQVTTTTPNLNIFRYLMEIKDGKVTITRDDVRAQYKKKLTRTVSEEELQELEDKISDTDFMDTRQPQAGICREGEDKVQTLTIAYGRDMNSITVRNTAPPLSFVETINALEDFSRDVLNIPPVSLTPEEMKKAGLDAYLKAKQHFDNWQAQDENLNIAIKFFGIAIENLEGFKYLPEYEKAYKYKQEAEILQKEQIDKHFANARRFYRLKDWKGAKEEMLAIMAKTDPGTGNYKKAKQALVQLEREIRKKRK